MKVTEVLPLKTLLGEGALWNYQTQQLYWIDIENRTLFILNPATNNNTAIKMKSRIGTVVPTREGNILVALEDGIYHFNLQDHAMEKIADPEPGNNGNRFNDGKCDPTGRFWVGSMSLAGKSNQGALYRIDHDFKVKKMIDGVTTSNGIVWSLDKSKMYYIDTRTRKVVGYEYDNASGEISNPRDAILVPESLGKPDGSTIDAEGMLWIAMWGGGCVTRWNPDSGELLLKIDVPALNVTSCAFGGENLDILFITTASIHMNGMEDRYPQAGKLFQVIPGVKGIRVNLFR